MHAMVAVHQPKSVHHFARSSIQPLLTLALFTRAAGRCQFRGCNDLLIEHHVTKGIGVFAEKAHIVAYSKQGPRGAKDRPADINSIDNLMLLCARCHKLVDDDPAQYPVERLRADKAAHEERIRRLTSLDQNYETTVVVMKARVGADAVQVSNGEVMEAIAPFYPDSNSFFTIDLTGFEGSGPDFYRAASKEIRRQLGRLMDRERELKRLSLFSIGPMPTLMDLGNVLSNKLPIDLFQLHRDSRDWTWQSGHPAVEYQVRQVRSGTDERRVAVMLSLSGTIPETAMPAAIDGSYTIYELTLATAAPNPSFLKQRLDLQAFEAAYRELIASIVRDHGTIETIALFPAVPAPVAVACGHQLLPKVHPRLDVYDYDKRGGGFAFALSVNGDRNL